MSKLFPISLQVEEVSVGAVLRLLDRTPGVAKIDLHLNGPSAQSGDNGGGQISQVQQKLLPHKNEADYRSRSRPNRAKPALAHALHVAPLHTNVMGEVLVRAGYNKQGLSGVIYRMLKEGSIRRTAPGTYKLTERGARLYPQETDSTEAPVRKPRTNSRKGVVDNSRGVRGLVLKSLEPGPMSRNDMERVLVNGGFSAKNASGPIVRMIAEGLVSRENKEYSLTENGREVLQSVTANS